MGRRPKQEEVPCCEKDCTSFVSWHHAAVYVPADPDPCGLQLHGLHADRCHPRLLLPQLRDTVHDAGASAHDPGDTPSCLWLCRACNDPRDPRCHRLVLLQRADREGDRPLKRGACRQCRCRHRLFDLHPPRCGLPDQQGHLPPACRGTCDAVRAVCVPCGHAKDQADGFFPL